MQRILSSMRKAIEDFNIIEDGDRIAVAYSGGKDSISLLMALKNLQMFFDKKFEIIAVSIHPGFEAFDTKLLETNCKNLNVQLFIEYSNAKEIIFDIRKEKNHRVFQRRQHYGIFTRKLGKKSSEIV